MQVKNIAVTFGDNDFGSVFQDTLSVLKILTIPETFTNMTENEVKEKVKDVIKLICNLQGVDQSYILESSMLKIGVNVDTEDYCRLVQSVYTLLDYENSYELYTTS